MSSDKDITEILTDDSGSLVNFDIGPFWFDAGIYKGENFMLFELGFAEISDAYPGKQVTVFHLHIGYFHLDFGFETKR